MKFLFAFILLVHGLIHLMGYVKAFKFAEVSQLTQPVSRGAGVFWLISALLFTAATLFFLLKKETWWMLAAPAIVLSQILIFTSWGDAKWGTAANVIVLAGVVIAFGSWQFNGRIQREIEAFRANPVAEQKILTREMIAGLPPVVQKWLERSNVVGKEMVNTAYLRQKGEMKTAPEGKWIPFEAEQYNTINPPGFIWRTEMEAMAGVKMTGRDRYVDGRGQMLIKLLGWFPVADAGGPETDQGAMLRNLAEICWFPGAALSDYIQWEQPDSLSAKATMTNGGITASGIFHFNPEGDMTGFEARRYYYRKTGATLEDWAIVNTGFKEFNGVRIPYKSEVAWKLAEGDYTWLRLEIVELGYNDPQWVNAR